jgi:hypothetical protein
MWACSCILNGMRTSPKGNIWFLLLLLAADAVFILIESYSSPRFAFKEGRYGEMFGYFQEGFIVLLLGLLAVRARQPWYFVWVSYFLYFLLDDSLGIHEKAGRLLYKGLDLPRSMFEMPTRDLGQLVVFAFLGLLFLAVVGAAYYFGDRTFKEVSRNLLMMLAVLIFCSVVVDVIHVYVNVNAHEAQLLIDLLALLEEGGELVIVSVILWYVFSWATQTEEKLASAKNIGK